MSKSKLSDSQVYEEVYNTRKLNPKGALKHVVANYESKAGYEKDLEQLDKLAAEHRQALRQASLAPGAASSAELKHAEDLLKKHTRAMHGNIMNAEEKIMAIEPKKGQALSKEAKELLSEYDGVAKRLGSTAPVQHFIQSANNVPINQMGNTHASIRHFTNVLERDEQVAPELKSFVAHSERMSELQNRPLGDVLHEQLRASGMHADKAQIYSDMATSFEKGQHQAHLKNFEKFYGRGRGYETAAEEASHFAPRLKRAGKIGAIVAGAALATGAVVAGAHSWANREEQRRSAAKDPSNPNLNV